MKRKVLAALAFIGVTLVSWIFIATMALQVVTTRQVPRWVPVVSLIFAALIGGTAAQAVLKQKKKDAAKLP